MNPVDFFASLGMAAHVGVVLSWVAFAISAGVGLTFALLGIRKGLAWFFAIVEERGIGRGDSTLSELDRAAALYDAHVSTHGDLYGVKSGDDDELERFRDWLGSYRRFGENGDNFDGSAVSAADLERWRS